MAWRAVVSGASRTDEESNGTAVHALPVDKLVAMWFARGLAPVELFRNALFAKEVLCLELVLRLHRLQTIHHATKVWNLALEALIKGAVVQRKIRQFAEIDVALCDDPACLVIALCYGHPNRRCHNLRLHL